MSSTSISDTLSGSRDIDDGGIVLVGSTGTGDFTLGTVTLTGSGWNTSNARLTTSGNELQLTGVTWAPAGTVLVVR